MKLATNSSSYEIPKPPLASAAPELQAKIERELRVGIIGLGYVGLQLATEFARCGLRVTVLLTDHSGFDYRAIAESSRLVIDTRNAFRAFRMDNIVRLSHSED